MNPFRSPFSFGDQMYGLNSNSGQLPSGPYGQQMGDPSVWAMMQRVGAQPQLPQMGNPQYAAMNRPMPSRMDAPQSGAPFSGNLQGVQQMQGAMGSLGRPGVDQKMQQQFGAPFSGNVQGVQQMQSALPGMTSTPYQMRRWQGGLLGGFTG